MRSVVDSGLEGHKGRLKLMPSILTMNLGHCLKGSITALKFLKLGNNFFNGSKEKYF